MLCSLRVDRRLYYRVVLRLREAGARPRRVTRCWRRAARRRLRRTPLAATPLPTRTATFGPAPRLRPSSLLLAPRAAAPSAVHPSKRDAASRLLLALREPRCGERPMPRHKVAEPHDHEAVLNPRLAALCMQHHHRQLPRGTCRAPKPRPWSVVSLCPCVLPRVCLCHRASHLRPLRRPAARGTR